jgi:hypothetical protein
MSAAAAFPAFRMPVVIRPDADVRAAIGAAETPANPKASARAATAAEEAAASCP